VDQHGVEEDTAFCEVNITTCYSCTRTAQFAHMNGHWKAYDQHGVEDTVFCEVKITMYYSCTRTAKFAHMNGHWKAYNI